MISRQAITRSEMILAHGGSRSQSLSVITLADGITRRGARAQHAFTPGRFGSPELAPGSR
jgi:hypothetical protein